jgi:glycosyltransferase involved in cell wall biosynthesis
MNEKLVSICIPTFNCGEYIEETLNSLINQTYKNIEIIIGDNASTDNSYDKIKKYQITDKRIKYYKNEINLGLFGNCNKLISMSQGEYVAIYHSDDIYDLKIIEKEVSVLESNNYLLGVFTLYERINEKGKILKNTQYPIITKKKITVVYLDEYINIVLGIGGSCFCCPTSMIRKNIYEKLNGYNENLKYVGDQDMWGRILLNGPMAILDEKLIKYRVHNKQLSSKYLEIEREDLSIPLKHIKGFLAKNLLEERFKDELLKAEAVDYIALAIFAVKRNNYQNFYEQLIKSRQICNLDYTTKTGFVQNLPIPRLTYFMVKIWQML